MIAIRDIRQAQGMTQKKLAEKLNITPNAISQWENGTRNPRLETVKRLAEILHCTTDDILNCKGVIQMQGLSGYAETKATNFNGAKRLPAGGYVLNVLDVSVEGYSWGSVISGWYTDCDHLISVQEIKKGAFKIPKDRLNPKNPANQKNAGSSAISVPTAEETLGDLSDFVEIGEEELAEKHFLRKELYLCFLNNLNRPKALFYCDPPYYKTEKFYDTTFSPADHERLNQCLDSIKGRFIPSYNDCEFIRDLYRDYEIIPVKRCNSLSKGSYKELIIKNF